MLDAPKQITDLVERFERNTESYHSQTYNETQLRREFIDPFFEALGWDVTNKAGYAEAYKDVIHEDAIKIGGATKAPDYCFRIGGVRKFFLEAKKPSVGIKDDVSPAYQLRRYAWSAKLPLSILTDFEEFAVYDCRFLPKPDDKSSTCRILYLTYHDYASRWEEIASVFSKDAVLKGSFDKFAIAGKGKRGTSEVDTEFLNEIGQWRDALARNLAMRNPNLTVRDLNFAVQRTIDRIIFLRMCEDRGVEPYGQLHALLNGENTYDRLRHLYHLADDRYSSGLFHFKPEKGRAEAPDELTLTLAIDDKALKDIIRRLYYPESPYEFSVLSADILGNVYEQFLGKVIRLTTGHRAVVEEKPEVKKAGGVYYTPAYIVDYIVKNTVGKLCEGKTPKQTAKLRILDPACGSGSFLIGAYAYLLDYHRNWYVDNDPKKHTKEIYQGAGGQWLLTTQEKKRILLKNIYGVDIDSQAVEVTKLSLLLKVLEGENKDTLERQFKMWRERALPDLGSNIKCGNSLIGPDFYANHQMNFLDEEQRYRINVFDWKAEFPKIMKAGGFDAVMGNPPYRSLLLGKKQESEDPAILAYYKRELPHATQYKVNLFGLFMEKCTQLLAQGGAFAFIIPNLFFTSHYFKDLRQHFLKRGVFRTLVDLRYKVFGQAEIGGNGVFVFENNKTIRKMAVYIVNSFEELKKSKAFFVNIKSIFKDTDFNLLKSPKARDLAAKIQQIPTIDLGKICTIYQGIITGNNSKYLSKKPLDGKWQKIIRGRDIDRYHLEFGGWYVLYEPKKLWSNANPEMYRIQEKLISRQTSDHLAATYDASSYLTLDSTHVIHLRNQLFSIKYLLGIYNSRLMNFLYTERVCESGRVFAQVKIVNLNQLPIRTINFDDPRDKARHGRMVVLVEQILELHKRLRDVKTPDEKTRLQRQIDATDGQIDRLVYELYGLTEEEIKIVEELH